LPEPKRLEKLAFGVLKCWCDRVYGRKWQALPRFDRMESNLLETNEQVKSIPQEVISRQLNSLAISAAKS
jgi:hypothetical protein